jgi:hypothetical protein
MGFAGTLVAPQLARLLEQSFRSRSRAAGSAGLGLQQFVDVAIQMVQALLLFNPLWSKYSNAQKDCGFL